MRLPLQNFTALVGNAAAAVQGSARQLLDLSAGSTLRAVLEANAGVALWLQWLIVLVLQATRASTSTGADLDSWVGDFGMMRLPSTAATGRVQLSRFSAAAVASVAAGTQVRTSDAQQSFVILPEPGNPNWQSTANAFVLPVGTSTVDVPVQALVSGLTGNVQAGSITLIAAAIAGVDTVANAAPLAGGLDAESDDALRQRFQLLLPTLSKATPLAVRAAVLSTRQGVSVAIAENMASDGSGAIGSFVCTVDDGTGTPPPQVLADAAAAIEAVRPLGTRFAVRSPTVHPVSISLSVLTSGNRATTAAAVGNAISRFVDLLPIGTGLPYSRIVQIAYDADPSIFNVANLLLNGGTADLPGDPGGVLKIATIQVN